MVCVLFPPCASLPVPVEGPNGGGVAVCVASIVSYAMSATKVPHRSTYADLGRCCLLSRGPGFADVSLVQAGGRA